MKNNSEKNHSAKKGLAIAIAAATAATALGVYFLYGKNAKKRRTQVKGWALKLKGEVLERVERLKDIDEASYHKIIDAITRRYASLKHIDKEELAALVKDLKQHWTSLRSNFQKSSAKRPSKSRTTATPSADKGEKSP
jgi:hypothetical protein